VPEKFYSVEEANALVPTLKPLLERIRATQEALAKDKTVAAVREKASHNGGGLPGRHLSELQRTLERDARQLQEWGIVLRDPSIGLIDFLHQREGETVVSAGSSASPESNGGTRSTPASPGGSTSSCFRGRPRE